MEDSVALPLPVRVLTDMFTLLDVCMMRYVTASLHMGISYVLQVSVSM